MDSATTEATRAQNLWWRLSGLRTVAEHASKQQQQQEEGPGPRVGTRLAALRLERDRDYPSPPSPLMLARSPSQLPMMRKPSYVSLMSAADLEGTAMTTSKAWESHQLAYLAHLRDGVSPPSNQRADSVGAAFSPAAAPAPASASASASAQGVPQARARIESSGDDWIIGSSDDDRDDGNDMHGAPPPPPPPPPLEPGYDEMDHGGGGGGGGDDEDDYNGSGDEMDQTVKSKSIRQSLSWASTQIQSSMETEFSSEYHHH